jgi:DNA-3-methyladenine glycosylase II
MARAAKSTLLYDSAEAIAHLRAVDPKLGALIDRTETIGGFTLTPRHTRSPFHSLFQAILYQQLHGKAAATIHRRVRLIYSSAEIRKAIEAGADHTQFADLLDDPHPQQLLDTPDDLLRAAGVSFNKIKAMRDLSARTLDGTVPTPAAIRKLADAEIIERLTAVRGIGSWTVEMLLIFTLGRPDVFHVTDYGVRKGYALTFQRVPRGRSSKPRALTAAELPKPEVMLRRAKRWSPYRSVAAWYMWRACDLDAASRKMVLPDNDD